MAKARLSRVPCREGGTGIGCARNLILSASTGRGVRKATRGRLGPWDEVPVSSSTVSARCTPRWLGGKGAAEPRAVQGGERVPGCSLILGASTGRGAQKPRRPGPPGRGVRGFPRRPGPPGRASVVSKSQGDRPPGRVVFDDRGLPAAASVGSKSHGDRGLPAAASVVLVGCNAPVAAAFWGGSR